MIEFERFGRDLLKTPGLKPEERAEIESYVTLMGTSNSNRVPEGSFLAVHREREGAFSLREISKTLAVARNEIAGVLPRQIYDEFDGGVHGQVRRAQIIAKRKAGDKWTSDRTISNTEIYYGGADLGRIFEALAYGANRKLKGFPEANLTIPVVERAKALASSTPKAEILKKFEEITKSNS